MQINSTIEMLKEVSLNSISEIGFSTVNNHAIRIGALTKYYSESFTTDSKKSLLAYCHSCKEIGPEQYLCDFLFFGADNQQISQIRRNLLQNKNHTVETLQQSSSTKKRILIMDEDVPLSLDQKTFLSERFGNSEVYTYSNYGQLLSDLADKETPNRQTLPVEFDMIFAGYDLFEIEKQKKWEQLQQYLQDRCKNHQVQMKTIPEL